MRRGRTESEFLNGSENVHAESHFQLVDLELHPFAERLEVGAHGDGIRREWRVEAARDSSFLVSRAARLGLLGIGWGAPSLQWAVQD
jgi:hypothetical protein